MAIAKTHLLAISKRAFGEASGFKRVLWTLASSHTLRWAPPRSPANCNISAAHPSARVFGDQPTKGESNDQSLLPLLFRMHLHGMPLWCRLHLYGIQLTGVAV